LANGFGTHLAKTQIMETTRNELPDLDVETCDECGCWFKWGEEPCVLCPTCLSKYTQPAPVLCECGEVAEVGAECAPCKAQRESFVP